MPHLVEVWKEYAPQGLALLALTDESAKIVEGGLERKGVKVPEYPIGCATRSGNAYGVRGIPAAFLLNYDGEIVWQGHPGGDGWVKLLPELLAEAADAGPIWDPGERDDALAKAVAAAKEGKLRDAKVEADRAAKKEPLKAKQFLVDLEATAKRRLDRGNMIANKFKPQEALNYFNVQISAFKGSGLEKEMMAAAKAIKADKDNKTILGLDKKRLQAVDALREGDRKKALKDLRSLVKKAKGTDIEDVVKETYEKARG